MKIIYVILIVIIITGLALGLGLGLGLKKNNKGPIGPGFYEKYTFSCPLDCSGPNSLKSVVGSSAEGAILGTYIYDKTQTIPNQRYIWTHDSNPGLIIRFDNDTKLNEWVFSVQSTNDKTGLQTDDSLYTGKSYNHPSAVNDINPNGWVYNTTSQKNVKISNLILKPGTGSTKKKLSNGAIAGIVIGSIFVLLISIIIARVIFVVVTITGLALGLGLGLGLKEKKIAPEPNPTRIGPGFYRQYTAICPGNCNSANSVRSLIGDTAANAILGTYTYNPAGYYNHYPYVWTHDTIPELTLQAQQTNESNMYLFWVISVDDKTGLDGNQSLNMKTLYNPAGGNTMPNDWQVYTGHGNGVANPIRVSDFFLKPGSPDPPPRSIRKLSIGVIAGIVIGSVFLLLILIIIYRKHKKITLN